jgi:hypothetical protein
MKKLIPWIFVLMTGLSVSGRAQQYSPPFSCAVGGKLLI